MNYRAMSDGGKITDNCRVFDAVDMDTAIILNICAFADGDIIVITAHGDLMPDAAVFANTHCANDGGGCGNKG